MSGDRRVALSVHDPLAPQRYLEVRGEVTAVEPDPEGTGTWALLDHYGHGDQEVLDRAIRVILTITPNRFSTFAAPARQD